VEIFEAIEIFPEHPWYVRGIPLDNGAHFFKGLQVAVVKNQNDPDGVGPYQEPLALFFGPDAKSQARCLISTWGPKC